MKLNKIILIPIFLFIALFVFIVLDNGFEKIEVNQIISPLFFSTTCVICLLFSYLRKYLLIVSIALLVLLVFTYLLQMLELSNWIGSLGFGIFLIIIFSYIPQIIKKGRIEKY